MKESKQTQFLNDLIDITWNIQMYIDEWKCPCLIIRLVEPWIINKNDFFFFYSPFSFVSFRSHGQDEPST